MSNQNSTVMTKMTKSQLKSAVAKIKKDKKSKIALKEDLITKQFRAKKLVTEAYTGALLVFRDTNTYRDEDTNEITSVMVKYHDEEKGGFYSVSLRDLLNKFTLGDGSTVAENVTFDAKGHWNIPTAIYISEVKHEEKAEDKVYPIAAYKGYSSSIFRLDSDKLAEKIEEIKQPANLKANAQPFLKEIVVEMDINKFPI